MSDLRQFAQRPSAFAVHHVMRRPIAHASILLAVILAVGCSVGSQYALKMLVDTLSAQHHDLHAVWQAFAVLAGVIAADNLLWRAAGIISSYAFTAVAGEVRTALFQYLLGHAPAYFADRLPGTLTSRVAAAANAMFVGENMMVWNVLPPALATASSIALLASVSARMTGILVVTAAVMTIVLLRMAASGRRLHRAFATETSAVDGELTDVVANLPLVRAFSGRHREYRRFQATVDREMQARRASLLYLERLRISHATATAMLTAGLLAWSIALWQRGAASPGDVVLAATLGFTVLHATRDLAVALVDLTQHFARLAEALSTLLVPYGVADKPGAGTLAAGDGSIVFDRVSFGYPDGRRVFDGLTLRCTGGERIGLVGPSGSGKSTLFALLQRQYDVDGGRILIGGTDIAEATLESLSATLGVVQQDVALFHRTVLENIRYGRPEATDDEVHAAADAALCSDFIAAMPDGFNSIVGDRGVKLSGGQRQRIAIARAFLKGAPILLLDEATSALDAESEAAVREALDRLMVSKTVVAIAHRLASLRDFDRIIVLGGGGVAQDGRPDQLARLGGPFRELMRRELSRPARRLA
jgi:ATP-binding cassette subfamily B protein